MKEETNLKLINPILRFIGCFEGNNRDPRDNKESWSKSYAFMHIIDKNLYLSQKESIIGMDDATEGLDGVSWKSFEEINNLVLAFDHNCIVNEAVKLMNNKIKYKR
jgi:ADP-ribose pyrophosphatase YjhB (NUDIX family)